MKVGQFRRCQVCRDGSGSFRFSLVQAGLREGRYLDRLGFGGLCVVSSRVFLKISLSRVPAQVARIVITAAADSTPYVAGATPEPALRQVFHVAGLPFALLVSRPGIKWMGD